MTTDLTLSGTIVLDPFTVIDRLTAADSTKTKYRRALRRYLDTGGSLTDPEALAQHAAELPASGRAFLKAAISHYCQGIVDTAKGQAVPANVASVQATIYRAEALTAAIPTDQAKGQKVHSWMSQREVKALLDACGAGLEGQRDRLVLGLLVAAGLRREEAAALRFSDLHLQPVGGRIRAVLAIKGKGAKDRAVPISDRLAAAIDAWVPVVGGQGLILRSLGRDGRPGDSLSPVGIFAIVRKRGAAIGKPGLAPHDLRRTYAQLGLDAGVPITQISRLLGHANIATTQRYLNLELDLTSTISDFVPF